jgi:hypothetical protein
LSLLAAGYRTEFDLDDLLRMDTAARTKAAADRIKASISSPNEERAKLGQLPVTGGESPMIQEQNFSLAAIAKRDAQDDPWASRSKPTLAGPSNNPTSPADDPAVDPDAADAAAKEARDFIEYIQKGIECAQI